MPESSAQDGAVEGDSIVHHGVMYLRWTFNRGAGHTLCGSRPAKPELSRLQSGIGLIEVPGRGGFIQLPTNPNVLFSIILENTENKSGSSFVPASPVNMFMASRCVLALRYGRPVVMAS